jgi:hypothetical protein
MDGQEAMAADPGRPPRMMRERKQRGVSQGYRPRADVL